jgi:hypothetical protein
MALAVFLHFPEVKHVRGGLVFVVSNNLIKETYAESDAQGLWAKWVGRVEAMKTAVRENVWNPKPSGLCKRHCPVTACVHNGDH